MGQIVGVAAVVVEDALVVVEGGERHDVRDILTQGVGSALTHVQVDWVARSRLGVPAAGLWHGLRGSMELLPHVGAELRDQWTVGLLAKTGLDRGLVLAASSAEDLQVVDMGLLPLSESGIL